MAEGPAQWHPDPSGRHEHRYWDGDRWTAHVADHGVSAEDPWVEPEPVEVIAEREPEPDPEPTTVEWRPPVVVREPEPEPGPEPGPEPEPGPGPSVLSGWAIRPATSAPSEPAPALAAPAAAPAPSPTWAATQVEDPQLRPAQVRRRTISVVAVAVVAAIALVGVVLAVRADDDDEPEPQDAAARILENPNDLTVPTLPAARTDQSTVVTLDDAIATTPGGASPPEITSETRAQLVAGLRDGVGLTQEQAECAADAILEALESGELRAEAGMDEILPYARACGFEGELG